MKLSSNFYPIVWKIFLFLALQTISILMVVKSGTVQHYFVFEKIRNMQFFFWNTSTQIKSYLDLKNINKEHFLQNLQLQNEVNQLRKELTNIKSSEYLDSLLLTKSFDFTWAKVVKNSFNNTHSYLIIDKGFKDGIAQEMGVIMPNGVVGIVTKTGAHYSYIQSFMNIDQNVSAKVSSKSVFGTMSCDLMSFSSAILHDIPQHIKINKADTVYTSGKSAIYPPDIPLGIVESSHVVNGTHQAIKVKLFLDYRNLDYVIIVKNLAKKEIDSLIMQ